MLASAGYPESSSKGDVIIGTETLDREDDVDVIHAGTARDAEGRLVTAGGRVLAVTAVGADVADARAKAYEGVAAIASTAPSTAPTSPPTAAASRSLARVTRGPERPRHPVRRADLAAIWSPEHKIVLERRLWIAVLRAQRDLGVDVPDGVVEAYEAVVDKVDLDSIAARERVTRHDVKARIEEFCALAGHEHIHKGMTSRDLTENVEQLQVRQSLELIRDRAVATLARLARLAVRARDHRDGRPLPQRRRAGDHARQALRDHRRRDADRASTRVEELLARYPLRGIKGPMGTAQDMLDLLDGSTASLAELEPRVAAHLGFERVLTSVGQVYPRSLDFDVRLGAGPAHRRPVQPGHHDPADGRHRAGHRGLQGGPGRLLRDAAQDEHPLVRAGQRPRRRPPRLPLDGRRAGR